MKYSTDRSAIAFVVLAFSYLIIGLSFGVLGGFQYLLPGFLKQQLAFQKVRPLHVYLVISWIFTAAQGCIYFFLPRIAGRAIRWKKGVALHFYLQLFISLSVICCFFLGYFGGREYLEFPPQLGILIICTWLPFAWNFFRTLRPDYPKAPVYIWSISTGILFFFITLSESYLWLFDYFSTNIVRDITVQWKALGGMVGSWNMLIYGCAMYVMEQISRDKSVARSNISFAFFFLGFTNLLFNWGHHTYIIPAAPWIRNVSYIISMTELLILGNIILKWKKTVSAAQKNRNDIAYRFLAWADWWIFINLTLAIAISVPALNYYTHGTHITVAHAMGATIGINTMLLFAAVFYMLRMKNPAVLEFYRRRITIAAKVTNLALAVFWLSLTGSGLVKIAGRLHNDSFSKIMETAKPLFTLFTFSGVVMMGGIVVIIVTALQISRRKIQRLMPINEPIKAKEAIQD